jgi:hypothetical protein
MDAVRPDLLHVATRAGGCDAMNNSRETIGLARCCGLILLGRSGLQRRQLDSFHLQSFVDRMVRIH